MTDNTERAQVGWGFWLRWVIASSVGVAVGLALFATIAFMSYFAESGSDALTSVTGGILLGASIGIAQWLVLLRKVSRAGWWVLASIAGAGVGVAVALPMREAVDLGGELAVGGALLGASVGIAQWLVLRRKVSRAGWWMLATIVGAGVGVAVALAVSLGGAEVGNKFVGDVLGFLVAPAVYGAITGGAMVWLLRQPVTEELTLPQDAE